MNDKIARRFINLGSAYIALKKYEEAKDAYKKAIKIEPKNTKYLELLLNLAMKTEDKSNAKKALEKMLKTDKGAKYIGEFAIGANYHIKQIMRNTLFDEKIGGTIHLALGRAYQEKRGGGENQSTIHWDIVKDTRLAGSKIKIDGKTILKQGKIIA